MQLEPNTCIMRDDINGNIYDPNIHRPKSNQPYQLIVLDPPYGKIAKGSWEHQGSDEILSRQLINLCHNLQVCSHPGAALYVYGGYGTPKNRVFYKFMIDLEIRTRWQIAAHITWSKKRAYGVQTNYLSTREEIAYCVLGNFKKPRVFNVPLLDEKRGYEGYDKKYPAKSEYKRRTMVWTDVTEILRGKVHECEKPKRLSEIIIETSSNAGDLILDGFAGSRNCATVAEQLKRHVISIELNPLL